MLGAINPVALPALRIAATFFLIVNIVGGTYIFRNRHRFFDRDPNVDEDIPAMRNLVGLRECLEEAYLKGPTIEDGGLIPNDEDLPLLLDRVYPSHEFVKIDYFLPGCPPSADTIWEALKALLTGQAPQLPYRLLKYE